MKVKNSEANLRIYGPYEVNLEVHVTDGDKRAVLAYGWGFSDALSDKAAHAAAQRCLDEAREALPGDGWRLCTKAEFLEDLVGHGATVGGPDFDEPEDAE